MTVTDEVVEFSTKTGYDDLPDDIVQVAKRHILDSIGVTMAGSLEPVTTMITKYVTTFGGSGSSVIIGSRQKTQPPMAALANATSGHALDYDDTQLSTSREAIYGLLTHPSVPVYAAALALADHLGVSGKKFLEAYAVGVEVSCRIADSMNPEHVWRGFHTTGTVGTLGATAAAAKILDLNDNELRNALGIASATGAGIRESFGTMVKPLQAGNAARNGVFAALVAKHGFEAPVDSISGKYGFFNVMGGGFNNDKIMGRLGRPFFFISPGISIKPYPSGSLTHPAMDLAFELAEAHDFEAGDINDVTVKTSSAMHIALRYSEPRTVLEAKFSMQYCVASVLVRRNITLADFRDEDRLKDSSLTRLMRKTSFEIDPELDKRGYERMRTRMIIRLIDGRVISGERDVARGHPEDPMTEEDLKAKFVNCACGVTSPEITDRIIEATRDLESISNIRDYTGLLSTSPNTNK